MRKLSKCYNLKNKSGTKTYSLAHILTFHLVSFVFWCLRCLAEKQRASKRNILGRTYKIFGRKTKAGNLLEQAPSHGAAKKKNKSGRNRECSLNKTSTKR